jgi:3-isopropylmalate dehydrogenase
MILSATMMLDHVGEVSKADRVRRAVASVVRSGSVRAYDMLKLAGGPDVLSRGAASTTEITDAIIAEIETE